jgi:hypothetical protein
MLWFDGDFGTPEQTIPGEPEPGQPWESCMTLNGQWGFAKYDHNWKSAATLTRNLLATASRDGNYLLNVGPDKRGRVPQESVTRLRQVGDWLRHAGHGNAVYGAGHTGLVADPEWGEVSRIDPRVNESWRFDGSPDPVVPADHFSARWTGSVQPRSTDTYTFTTVSDDTARVWIDGKLVIDSGLPHTPRVDKGTIRLRAGETYDIKVEHREQTGEAHMKPLWSRPNQSQQIVPSRQLYLP